MAELLWRENIKICRKNLGLTQAQLADKIGRTQQTINNWERGINDPSLEDMARLTIIFGISLDQLFNDVQVIKKNKDAKNSKNVQENVQENVQVNTKKGHLKSVLNKPETPYISSKMPAIITVNQAGIDNIIFVPIKAQAGYLIGYGDREFIETLPSFQMPGLRNGTYRMFEVQGISMHPTLSNGDRVIGEFVNNIGEIRENRVHIVVTPTGVLVKRVINRLDRDGKIYLKSDTLHHRADFPIIPIDPEEILEIWYVRMAVTTDLGEPSETYQRLSDLEVTVQKITEKIGLK